MPSSILLIIEAGAAILYYISSCAGFLKKNKIAYPLWGVAVVANATIIVQNWLVNGYVPFVSMYQVITFLAFVFTPIYLYISYMYKGKWMFGYFSFASGICMTGVCFMGGSGVWHFPPALQSVWFVPHILAYMISYSLITVGCIITIVSLFKKKDRNQFDLGTYHLYHTAFPFMTMGMLFGAIWANDIWGEFWSFDAKENWSLVTWLMVTLYLHYRRNPDLKKYSKIFVVLGFVGVVITMIFVNFMGGSSQHSYSM